ncbi:MAG: hypothetical protein HRF46_02135 [Acidobacteriota bacterium]|jgi:hypothetical protein
MSRLTTDMDRAELRPYFLWDEELTLGELRQALASGDEAKRLRLLAKVLREARDDEVWRLVSPTEVAEALPRLAPFLGRRRAFWEFLITGWRQDGLLP